MILNPAIFQSPRLNSIGDQFPEMESVDVLRLDQVHPLISGNKWYKLRGYLEEASRKGCSRLLTFGGAYSNHLLATAAAAKEAGLKSTGIVRGEKPENLSPTLIEAAQLGMELEFISRKAYAKGEVPTHWQEGISNGTTFRIEEGGYGSAGARGAGTILDACDVEQYTHILSAAGTGTMAAGLVARANEKQTVVAISVLKNNYSLKASIEALVPERKAGLELLHEFHFSGYAKHPPPLIAFMNEWYRKTGLPSDLVYTAKLFYALKELAERKYFPLGSRLLLIHSGGLQGNRSLPKGTLIF